MDRGLSYREVADLFGITVMDLRIAERIKARSPEIFADLKAGKYETVDEAYRAMIEVAR